MADPERDGGGGVTDRVRVLTANILNTSYGWDQRRPVLAAGLAALDADLIAFQETVVTADYDQVVDMSGDGCHVVHSESRDEKGEGTSIASRWPIEAVWNVDHALTDRARGIPVGAVIAEIRVPDPIGPLLFVNHFPSWTVDHERERELQAVATARGIATALAGRQLPVVIGGDMDAEPDAASIRFWSGRQALDGLSVCYVDCWAALHPDRGRRGRGHVHASQRHPRCDGPDVAVPPHRLPLRHLQRPRRPAAGALRGGPRRTGRRRLAERPLRGHGRPDPQVGRALVTSSPRAGSTL